MESLSIKLILLPLLLTACSHLPHASTHSSNTVSPPAGLEASQSASVAKQNPPALPRLDLPNLELDDRMVFEFLLGDIAVQRGRPELAAQVYFELAKTTRDPRVAKRAAQLAYESRQMEKAVEAFSLWQEIEPSAPLAKQMLLSLLLGGGKLQEAKPHVESLLKADADSVRQVFLQLHPLLARAPNKAAALDWLSEIALPYPKVAEAHWALAQVAAAANNKERALVEIRLAETLRPDWDMAVVFEAQLLMPTEPEKALTVLRQFVQANKRNKEVGLFYARALLEQKKYAESRAQFQLLLVNSPENTELIFAVALLSLQMGELDRAEKELQATLQAGKKDAGTVHYYLGQLSEAKKNDHAALVQYRQVAEGEYVFAARLREAYLVNKEGRLEEARAVLKSIQSLNNQQRVTVILIEAQMLREAKQFESSYQVLAEGLEKLPNHPQLLFEVSMAADKLGKTEIFEQNLRKLLQIAPDHAQAYNALGYSYLERNVRLEEGMQLVERAYQLLPDDAAITDSVGWGHYRLGNLTKSVEFLRRAFAANPDPEIAAHLGEVLWQQGNKSEAAKVWQDTLKAHPESDPLRAIIKKHLPE